MKAELVLPFTFIASHSLGGYEEPHPHLWRLEVILTGKIIEGKILDIVLARSAFERVLDTMRDTYLNDNLDVSQSVRNAPTCETLSQFFWERATEMVQDSFQKHNSTVRLQSVGVGLSDLNEREMGFVRIGV